MDNHGRLYVNPSNPEGQPYLIGTSCEKCGDVQFPPKGACPNCLVPGTLREEKIGAKGTISSYSILHVAPEGFPVPHVQAMVKLDEGPLIFSILDTENTEAVAINQPVNLTIGTIQKKANGEDVVGWMYKPEGESQHE